MANRKGPNMKLMNLIWVLGLAGVVVACNSGDALQGCADFNELTGTCGSATGGATGTGGTGGTGNVGGAVEGACTNEADTAVYDALEYKSLTGPEAASQMASDCVFGGCGQEAQGVLTCRSECEDEIQALTDCVVECQQTQIEDTTGERLTTECADCYGESVTCSAVNCASEGCTVPDSPTCVACRCLYNCTPGFDVCSGLPSQNTCG